MGQFARLPWMSRNMGLKLLHIPLSEEAVKAAVKIGISLLDISFVQNAFPMGANVMGTSGMADPRRGFKEKRP